VLTTNLGTSATIFVGNHYEVTDGVVTKYYFAGPASGQRIATLAPHCVWCSAGVRTNDTLTYLFSDHLGSTSLTTGAAGNLLSQMKYKAWGEVRYNSGVTPTDYTLRQAQGIAYTGQYSHTADFGLLFYSEASPWDNARWYDPSLGRFAQADSIVPSGVQGLDRYAYVNNSPMNYVDPSGHEPKYGCYNSNGNTCLNANGSTIRHGRGQPIGNGNDLGLVFNAGSNYDGLDDDTQSFIIAATEEAYNMYDAYCQGGNRACEFSSAQELYTATHGTTVIEFSNSSLDLYCQRNGDGIMCGSNSRGKIDLITAAHELGHVFNALITNNGYPLNDPYHDLVNEQATNPLFPELNVAITDGYNRHHALPGEHGEDFANMYSMWVFNAWDGTPEGSERRDFMNDNMYTWIRRMLNP
jgi:RHS repeat-associated protein